MEPETKSSGAFVGLVIIIIILIIGGIYMWMSSQNSSENAKVSSEAVTTEDANTVDALGQEATTLDTNVGVDASTIK